MPKQVLLLVIKNISWRHWKACQKTARLVLHIYFTKFCKLCDTYWLSFEHRHSVLKEANTFHIQVIHPQNVTESKCINMQAKYYSIIVFVFLSVLYILLILKVENMCSGIHSARLKCDYWQTCFCNFCLFSPNILKSRVYSSININSELVTIL